MPARLSSMLPKTALLALVALLGTAGLTYAAEQQLAATPAATPTVPPVQKRATLIVPDLSHQAFVFAKGVLQDSGFAWRVVGGVRGYAANVVVAQSPVAGTKVFDTGAPLVKLTLSRNSKYSQAGAPQDISPYRATPIQLYAASPALPSAAPAIVPDPAATPAPATSATTTATTPAVTTTAAAPEVAPAAKSAPAKSAPAKSPQRRPAAFNVAGAPKEPLDEMPLTDRARTLGRWLSTHPKPTDANVQHWLYQNEWIVTGAKFGWWRGAEALRLLITVDRRAETVWGIGSKSEAIAVASLSEVEASAR